MPGGQAQHPTITQAAVSNSPIDKFKADWATYPPGKRAIYIFCPFVMVAALIFLFSDSPQDAAPTKPVASTTPSSMTPAGGPTVNLGMAGAGSGLGAMPTTTSTVTPGLQGNGGGAGFQGGTSQPTAAVPATANIFGNPPPTPTASSSASASAAGGSNGKPPPAGAAANSGDAGALDPAMGVEPKVRTNERKAADAWAEGNYEVAAQMYDELARENPGNPAFPAAAAILREKLDGGAH
jgi:hypothetical protein